MDNVQIDDRSEIDISARNSLTKHSWEVPKEKRGEEEEIIPLLDV